MLRTLLRIGAAIALVGVGVAQVRSADACPPLVLKDVNGNPGTVSCPTWWCFGNEPWGQANNQGVCNGNATLSAQGDGISARLNGGYCVDAAGLRGGHVVCSVEDVTVDGSSAADLSGKCAGADTLSWGVEEGFSPCAIVSP